MKQLKGYRAIGYKLEGDPGNVAEVRTRRVRLGRQKGHQAAKKRL